MRRLKPSPPLFSSRHLPRGSVSQATQSAGRSTRSSCSHGTDPKKPAHRRPPSVPLFTLCASAPARYVFVHEERGLLVISKKPDKRKPYWHKDNTNFPLADCTILTEEDTCLAITCNHERLLLRASCASERDRWVAGLRSAQSRSRR